MDSSGPRTQTFLTGQLGGAQRAAFPGTEGLNPQQIFAQAGYTAPQRARDGWAIAAAVFSFFGIVMPFLALFGVLCGVVSLSRMRSARYSVDSRVMARFGVVIGSASVILWLWAWLLFVGFAG